MELLYRNEVYAIVGAAIEVHRQLHSHYLEAVHQEAMEIELADRGIPFIPQAPISIFYQGRELRKKYVADFLCYEKIIVEIKVMERLTSKEQAQVLNYAHATGHRLGVLINFGDPGRLDWQRLVV
ncbi:MAG TPA: GxxExxY protein [Humisphaera sp.]